MDGVLVAYHNTERMFGFQYIPLEEMDARLYGHKDAGPKVFEKCTKLLEVVTEEIVGHFPEQVSTYLSWSASSEASATAYWVHLGS